MLLKKVIPAMLLLSLGGQALASEIITVSRFEVGKTAWPFSREEVMLSCEKDGSLFAINPSTLMQYPLNDKAEARVKAGQVKAQPISVIQAEDKAHPGQMMSLQPIIERTQALCDK
ncbi:MULTISPECIES: YebY family protein [Pantoea]|uniref:YebY family protein n=1 Tax=Pantoea TaxID=53335 RepID=UPI0005340B95|nr:MULTISPECIES: YebY family protein [Pantoea]MBS6438476.1 YebY family protein [Pantoea sp.]MDU1575473.1 YebY family protein [Pantoea sp.]MDU2730706.1 YebY family protein [Pantoea sp.]MDU6078380.1 YebY family protein [Pantoea sp.]MDU7840449.1 YebY family protein [Pantoea sp.]